MSNSIETSGCLKATGTLYLKLHLESKKNNTIQLNKSQPLKRSKHTSTRSEKKLEKTNEKLKQQNKSKSNRCMMNIEKNKTRKNNFL